MSSFDVVPGSVVRDLLRDHDAVRTAVLDAYLQHGRGRTTNPDSYFLRFEDLPSSRIIALPARVEMPDGQDVAGIKWISSFPANVALGEPRASAVLVLNSLENGRPYALLEAAGISAARTAASAALVARALDRTHPGDGTLGVVGGGVIARTTLEHLVSAGSDIDTVLVHDTAQESAQRLVDHARGLGVDAATVPLDAALDCARVVTATTALTPYVTRPPGVGQVYLNISLRDFDPRAVLDVQHVVDDVDHCLKADTTPHLVEQLTGSRDFVTGTVPQLLEGDLELDPARGVLVSPFGLGVLDLAVGLHVHTAARAAGRVVPVPDFFGETRRWA
ncbi:ornithine cyclodeaminase [Cellulomonas sp. HZM]|uniref:ornithine cyclodeaminase n=1 Tax=Cellulomonas sp. HZM TaxID=1454010 RepID=UPI000493A87E|nr:ornithine cyclodeaminase [Cellulomonas sp. HZM]